ncbi:hypothetical protein KIPB_011525, partial [Kipferlia bialata]|eukprot:g11525.t1
MGKYEASQLYVLSNFFVGHLTHPYPTREEVKDLGEKCALPTKRVDVWFGNRRKRLRRRTLNLLESPPAA